MIIMSLYNRISSTVEKKCLYSPLYHFTRHSIFMLSEAVTKTGLKLTVLQSKNKCSDAPTDFADTKPLDEEITYS